MGFPARLARRFFRKIGRRSDKVEVPVVISYPGCGRTWLMVMLDRLNLQVRYSHDGTEHRAKRHFSELSADKSRYSRRRVVLLVRDPRDAVVSGFFEASKRLPGAPLELRYTGSLPDFVRDPCHGIEKIVTFYSNWHIQQGVPAACLVVSYEEMRSDTRAALGKIAGFVSKDPISSDRIAEAARFADFERMKRKEKEGAFRERYGELLVPGDPEDRESFKVRRGRVGGWREYLQKDDSEYCKKVMETLKCPWYLS